MAPSKSTKVSTPEGGVSGVSSASHTIAVVDNNVAGSTESAADQKTKSNTESSGKTSHSESSSKVTSSSSETVTCESYNSRDMIQC